MQHAQFRMIPPLVKVKELFIQITGEAFHVGVTWTDWLPTANSDPFEVFRPYIRPSHSALLNTVTTAIATYVHPNPLPFLRQLLRPHGYKIETTTTGWILREKLTSDNPVVKVHTSPVRLDWN